MTILTPILMTTMPMMIMNKLSMHTSMGNTVTLTKDTLTPVMRGWYRLMDAIEPEHLERVEQVIHKQEQVKQLRWLRMRWLGHRLHADIGIAVDPQLTTAASHAIAEQLRHDLYHQLPYLAEIMVHVDPWSAQPEEHHHLTAHHEVDMATQAAQVAQATS